MAVACVLCQPDQAASCAGCCGLYNYLPHDRMSLATRLAGPGGRILVGQDTRRSGDMLVAARDGIGQAMAAGQTLEQIRAAKLMAEYDATWGDSDGFVGFVFQSLQR